MCSPGAEGWQLIAGRPPAQRRLGRSGYHGERRETSLGITLRPKTRLMGDIRGVCGLGSSTPFTGREAQRERHFEVILAACPSRSRRSPRRRPFARSIDMVYAEARPLRRPSLHAKEKAGMVVRRYDSQRRPGRPRRLEARARSLQRRAEVERQLIVVLIRVVARLSLVLGLIAPLRIGRAGLGQRNDPESCLLYTSPSPRD